MNQGHEGFPSSRILRVRYRQKFMSDNYPGEWYEKTVHVVSDSVEQAKRTVELLTETFFSNWIKDRKNGRVIVDVLEAVLVDEHGFVSKEILR